MIISCNEATPIARGASVITRSSSNSPAYHARRTTIDACKTPPAAIVAQLNMAMAEVLADEDLKDLKKRPDHRQEQIEQR